MRDNNFHTTITYLHIYSKNDFDHIDECLTDLGVTGVKAKELVAPVLGYGVGTHLTVCLIMAATACRRSHFCYV